MQTYIVQPGESPAAIAIKFAGCPKCAIDLVRSNPHKEVVVFPNGFTTFRELAAGETLNLPDKWFDGSMDALPKSYFASLPHADGRTPGVLGAALTISAPLLAAAKSAAAAIAADPSYCTSVAQPGSSVNAAVHAFKLAWNASQVSKVPIGTSNYESPTAGALRDVLGGAPVACSGAPIPVIPALAKKEEGLSAADIAGIGLLGAGAIGGILYWATRNPPQRNASRPRRNRRLSLVNEGSAMSIRPSRVYVGFRQGSWVAVTEKHVILARSTRRKDMERVAKAFHTAQKRLGIADPMNVEVVDLVREILPSLASAIL